MSAEARVTPYELVLEPMEHDAFPEIRAEAEQRGRDALRHDDFLLLGVVGATLSAMIADDAPPEAVDQYGELLWHGYRFWSAGRRFYVFGDATTSTLIAPRYDMAGWHLAAPPSCYLQFPNQRFWTRVALEAPFEPVDGCFVTADERTVDARTLVDVHILLVLGVRPERPGVSLVIEHLEIAPMEAEDRAAEPWTAGEDAFSTSLQGGEKRGLRTLSTQGELEALVLRALHTLDTRPKHLFAHSARQSPPAGASRLAYVEVRDDGGSG